MNAGVRNQFSGSVTEIKKGDVMSQVTAKVGDQSVTSVMTTDSVNEAGFKEGDPVSVLIKAIHVVMVK